MVSLLASATMYAILKKVVGEKILLEFLNKECNFSEDKKIIDMIMEYLGNYSGPLGLENQHYIGIYCVDQQGECYPVTVTSKWIDFLKEKASVLPLTRDELLYLKTLKY